MTPGSESRPSVRLIYRVPEYQQAIFRKVFINLPFTTATTAGNAHSGDLQFWPPMAPPSMARPMRTIPSAPNPPPCCWRFRWLPSAPRPPFGKMETMPDQPLWSVEVRLAGWRSSRQHRDSSKELPLRRDVRSLGRLLAKWWWNRPGSRCLRWSSSCAAC